MKRLSMILLGVLTLPAYGNIASQEYVDAQIGEVSKTVTSKAKKSGYTENMLLQTDNNGELTATTLKTNMIENGAVTNSKLAPNIGLDKLDMGTLPTSGKHIMIWNSTTNKYVFEELMGKPTLQCSSGTYDIGFSQCIDPATNGSEYGHMNDSTGESGAWTSNTATYGLTTDQTWGATLYTGDKVTGIASCNSTPGTYAQSTNQNFNQTDKGQYCWCKMTFPAVSRWVFSYDNDSAATCAYYCAGNCGRRVQAYSDFRSGVFSTVGN